MIATRSWILFIAVLGAANVLVLASTREAPAIVDEHAEPHRDESAAPVAAPLADPGGRISVQTTAVELGRRFSDEVVEAGISVTNVGKGPLRILRVESGCGCATVSVPADPLLPGTGATLKISVRMAGMDGELDRVALVHSDDPLRRAAPVRIKARVEPRLIAEPAALVLNPGQPGVEARAQFRVSRADGLGLDTVEVHCDQDALTVRDEGIQSGKAVFTVSAAATDRPRKVPVLVHSGLWERIVVVEVIPYMEVVPSPTKVSMGLARRGQGADIALHGKVDGWRLEGVECTTKWLSATARGESVHVEVSPGAPRGVLFGEVRIRLHGANPSELVVPVSAFVKE